MLSFELPHFEFQTDYATDPIIYPVHRSIYEALDALESELLQMPGPPRILCSYDPRLLRKFPWLQVRFLNVIYNLGETEQFPNYKAPDHPYIGNIVYLHREYGIDRHGLFYTDSREYGIDRHVLVYTDSTENPDYFTPDEIHILNLLDTLTDGLIYASLWSEENQKWRKYLTNSIRSVYNQENETEQPDWRTIYAI